MVSLRRSHCHSASVTFIGRVWDRTRSRAWRRTSSSPRRSSSEVATSLPVARRTMRRVAFCPAASSREQPTQPRPHFFKAVPPNADTRPKSSPRSTSTITGSWRWSGSEDDQVKYSSRFPLNRTSTTGVKSLLGERTHGKVLRLAPPEELLDAEPLQVVEMALQGLAADARRCFRVRVGAPGGLGDDLVDHAEPEQVGRGDLEGFGGALALAGVFPENRGAALGGDDRVD